METWRKQRVRHSSSRSTSCRLAVTMETAGSVIVSIPLPFISLGKENKNQHAVKIEGGSVHTCTVTNFHWWFTYTLIAWLCKSTIGRNIQSDGRRGPVQEGTRNDWILRTWWRDNDLKRFKWVEASQAWEHYVYNASNAHTSRLSFLTLKYPMDISSPQRAPWM